MTRISPLGFVALGPRPGPAHHRAVRRFELDFILRRPWLWGPGLRSLHRARTGRAVLRSVELGVTYACPMACGYCSASELMTERGQALTLAEWERVIQQSVDLGALHFLLTGGDPLLSSSAEALVAMVRARRRVVSLVTTGWGLDRHRARSLVAAGLDGAEISLDGASAAVHDAARRRDGAFDSAMNAAAALRAERALVLFTHVATRDSLATGEVFRIADLCRDMGLVLNLGFPAMAGRIDEDWSALLREWEWEELEQLLRQPHVRCCADSSYSGRMCTAGSEKLYVTRFGDVSPCPLLPSLRFGTVRDTPLSVLWARMRAVPALATANPRCLPAADVGFISQHV